MFVFKQLLLLKAKHEVPELSKSAARPSDGDRRSSAKEQISRLRRGFQRADQWRVAIGSLLGDEGRDPRSPFDLRSVQL